MNTTTMKRSKWFFPWQDEKEEAWLEELSTSGWHLKSVSLPCVYSFVKGEPCRNIYRLDYMMMKKDKMEEYLQIFQDAGWEYIGEMSNWRYWRKRIENGETAEIFTDNESKIKKYQRMLGYMAFFLFFLVFISMNMLVNRPWNEFENAPLINAIYLFGALCYAIIIPIYVVVVIKLLRRIAELKGKRL
jgi:hypothetical protein